MNSIMLFNTMIGFVYFMGFALVVSCIRRGYALILLSFLLIFCLICLLFSFNHEMHIFLLISLLGILLFFCFFILLKSLENHELKNN